MAPLLPGSQVTHLVLQFFRSVCLMCLLHIPDNDAPPCFVSLLSPCAHHSQRKHQPPFSIISMALSIHRAPLLESRMCVCTHIRSLIRSSPPSEMVLVSPLLHRGGIRHGRWENHFPDIIRGISGRARNCVPAIPPRSCALVSVLVFRFFVQSTVC